MYFLYAAAVFSLLCGALGLLYLALRTCLAIIARLFHFQLSMPSSIGKCRDPPVFTGKPSSLYEWAFAMQEALHSARPADEVRYAVSFLEGDARRWFISLCEDGCRPSSWPELKKKLSECFSPEHEDAMKRLSLLRTRQTGSLEDYITEFGRQSLLSRSMDELTKTIVFTEGLDNNLRQAVRREYPKSLQAAIRAARTASDVMDPLLPQVVSSPVSSLPHGACTSSEHSGGEVGVARAENSLPRLSSREKERLLRERRCFACKRQGHIARDCRAFTSSARHPNGSRQFV